MGTLQIKKAVKFEAKMRLALYGPSGSGKTYSALSIAGELKGNKRVLVIDTERGSASKYADLFDFDVIEVNSFHPHTYIEAIKMAGRAADEYSVLIIDSASHEWSGSKGALEIAGQNFTNWAKVTPLHNAFIDAMLDSPLHVIATMRAKEKFEMVNVLQKDGKTTKSEVQKIGMEVIQGKDIQYEFDIVGSLDMDNVLTIQKTRCSDLKGGIYPFPGREFAGIVIPWLAGNPVAEASQPHLEEQVAPISLVASHPQEVSTSSLRKLLASLQLPGPERQAMTLEAYYKVVCKKTFTSDDAISPEECQMMQNRLNIAIQTRENKAS